MSLASLNAQVKAKRPRKKKTTEQPPAPTVFEQCAQCGKAFDYRDRIYNGPSHGLCNTCRQRQNKFLLKGQYQRLQVKNNDGEDMQIVNAFRGDNRQKRRQVTSLNARMDAAAARKDMQEWQRLYRMARSKGIVN